MKSIVGCLEETFVHKQWAMGSTSAQLPHPKEALKEVEAWARDVSGQCHAASPTPRKFHVFINPASGNGQAEAKWQVARELFRSLPWISCQEALAAAERCTRSAFWVR